eukprot:scpid102775/ scgid2998/ Sodium channel protein type 8 subunit alpha; Peripheral nerve protein type 4; Sodium channel 6; Sodium channel protein type VIII subunit alpha; Voltage-gated sodium channel subunit alpha Nav1.6
MSTTEHVLCMCLVCLAQSKTWTEVQFYLNLTLTTFYILEATVKIYTWRKAYFQSGWNLFDLLIIMLGIAGNSEFQSFSSLFLKLETKHPIRKTRKKEEMTKQQTSKTLNEWGCKCN